MLCVWPCVGSDCASPGLPPGCACWSGPAATATEVSARNAQGGGGGRVREARTRPPNHARHVRGGMGRHNLIVGLARFPTYLPTSYTVMSLPTPQSGCAGPGINCVHRCAPRTPVKVWIEKEIREERGEEKKERRGERRREEERGESLLY